MLPVLVHALQPVGHPAAAGFQMGHLELGESLQHAVGAVGYAGQHLLQRMTSDLAAEFAITVRIRLRQHRAGALMDADGDSRAAAVW